MNYPRRWLSFWVIVSAIGVGLALLQWSWLTVIAAFAATAAMLTLFVVTASEVPDGARQLSALTWRVVGIGAEGAAALVAFVAVANLSKTLGVFLLAAVGASSPWLVRRLSRRFRSRDWQQPTYPQGSLEPHPQPAPVPLPKVEVRDMTTADLCQAWRRSFLLLCSATSILERTRIVGCRQLYLDELERRSPRGLRAWLDSGARAAGSPERYVADDPEHGHPDAA
jgi:hypothetical protein